MEPQSTSPDIIYLTIFVYFPLRDGPTNKPPACRQIKLKLNIRSHDFKVDVVMYIVLHGRRILKDVDDHYKQSGRFHLKGF